MVKGDFHLGMMGWKSWIGSPGYTLNSFKYRSNSVNFTHWEREKFQELLNLADKESNFDLRMAYYAEAEKLLMDECPATPINYQFAQFKQKRALKNVFSPISGSIDFKKAYISPK